MKWSVITVLCVAVVIFSLIWMPRKRASNTQFKNTDEMMQFLATEAIDISKKATI